MTHICYIYIYKYQCLQDVELVFDSRYDYLFNREEMKLTINKSSQTLPDKFWGEGIWSLTGIFGNNGAGKTTAIKFLLEAVVSGYNIEDVNGIVVYEANGKLRIYYNQDFENERKLTIKTEEKYSYINKLNFSDKIETFFFSGHFSSVLFKDKFYSNFGGLYNASIVSQFNNDVERFANTTDNYFNLPICFYVAANKSQHNDRICKIISNEKLRKQFKSFEFPKYVIISPNRGGQDHLKYHKSAKEKKDRISKYLNPNPTSYAFTRQEALSRFIYFNLLNLYADDRLFDGKEQIIIDWYNIVEENSYSTKSFDALKKQYEKIIEKFINEESVYSHLKSVIEFVSFLDSTCRFYEDRGIFYLDIIKDKDKVNKLLEKDKSCNFLLTSRLYDMEYRHDINSSSKLSSGEEAMLNLFSSMYDAIELKPQKISNIKSPSLLVLDEAEIGFHPEWQRNYIKTLLDFVKALSSVSGHDYQIVITSHSPILLSDIPVNCCNFLKKEKVGDYEFKTTNVRKSQPQTFARNVFELYRNSFFLEDGLIGTFAVEKLKSLEEKCKNGESKKSEIDLIGDERLQEYFRILHLKKIQLDAIEYYEKKLKELKEEKK